LLNGLPAAEWMIAGRSYDADWFREALKDKGIHPCILGRTSRGNAVRYDKRGYRRRNRIEIMFGGLKDWRRIAPRYDRCAKTFLSAVALTATVTAGDPCWHVGEPVRRSAFSGVAGRGFRGCFGQRRHACGKVARGRWLPRRDFVGDQHVGGYDDLSHRLNAH
jgi:transposase